MSHPRSSACGTPAPLRSRRFIQMPRFLTEEEQEQLVAWRRDFHAHPELAYQETRTSGIVANHLKECGYEVLTGVGGTGVIGLLRGNEPGKTLMLRADMD